MVMVEELLVVMVEKNSGYLGEILKSSFGGFGSVFTPKKNLGHVDRFNSVSEVL